MVYYLENRSQLKKKKFPIKPLKLKSFLDIWKENYPRLHVKPNGSDFCDT